MPKDVSNFYTWCSSLGKETSYDDFKYSMWADNVGGNCPFRLRSVGKYLKDGLSLDNAYLFSLIPHLKCIDVSIDNNFIESNKEYIYSTINFKSNKNSNLFGTPLVLFYNIKDLEPAFLDFLRMLICMTENPYNYMTVFTSKRGKSCIVFSGDIKNDEDITYFYKYISGASFISGFCDVEYLDDDEVEISYVFTNKDVMRREINDYKKFKGYMVRTFIGR